MAAAPRDPPACPEGDEPASCCCARAEPAEVIALTARGEDTFARMRCLGCPKTFNRVWVG